MTQERTGSGRLILHIGTHKTGTTSFQASLESNAAKLADIGVGAVNEPFIARSGTAGRRYNLMGLSDLFVRADLVTGHRIRFAQARPKGALQRAWLRESWARALARRPERDLLLSAEVFCFLRTGREARRVRRFLAATLRHPVILLATRNMADWRASWTAQLAASKPQREALAKIDPASRIDAPWYFDLDAICAFWSEVREIDFDAAVEEDGNIVPRLYRAAGIELTGLDMEVRLNTRAGRS